MSENKSGTLGNCESHAPGHGIAHEKSSDFSPCQNWAPLPSSEGTVKTGVCKCGHIAKHHFSNGMCSHVCDCLTLVLEDDNYGKQEKEAHQSAASASGESSDAKFSGSAEPQAATSERRQSTSEE